LKIAIYTHYFTPETGAPSIRLHDLAREWIKLGHQVQVITCFPNHPQGRLYPGYRGGLYGHEVLDGVDVHRHWTFITPNHGLVKRTLGHLSFLPGALLVSNRRLERPDVVIGSSPTFPVAGAAAWTARSLRIPFVMEVRDLWPAVFTELGVTRNQTLVRWLEKIELNLYRRARRVVTVTESFRQNLLSRGVPAEKVFTIPNGADLDYWVPAEAPSELRRRLGLEDSFVALYIGTHGISQALGSILRSAELLSDRKDIHFLFVGDGAEKAGLVQQAATAGLANVTFLDSVGKEAVRDYYALADVCLLPLRDIPLFDGFIPSKMFEMMAMARPVIGAVRGEAAAILERSGAAIVVQPEDATGIAGAIAGLASDPERRLAMGASGRRFVAEQYGRERLAADYARVLEGAIESAGRS
jgi:glycosyltransferase involved in cell wall biosynthesis